MAMEATGVAWKPVWNILGEGTLELMVATAHIKNVPGATDRNDAMWIAMSIAEWFAEWFADLVSCGLTRARRSWPAAV
jgi:transposase